MDRVETVRALADASRKVDISAIVPKSHGHIPLEQIAENIYNIEILRIDEEISREYIVYGKVGVNMWNSKKKTLYILEVDKGVIRRVSLVNNSFLNHSQECFFNRTRAQIRDKALGV